MGHGWPIQFYRAQWELRILPGVSGYPGPTVKVALADCRQVLLARLGSQLLQSTQKVWEDFHTAPWALELRLERGGMRWRQACKMSNTSQSSVRNYTYPAEAPRSAPRRAPKAAEERSQALKKQLADAEARFLGLKRLGCEVLV